MSTGDIKQQSPDSAEISACHQLTLRFQTLQLNKNSSPFNPYYCQGDHRLVSFLSSICLYSWQRPKEQCFLDDMTVSRNHATIDLSNLMWLCNCEDLDSLSMVPGSMVPYQQTTLRDGSTIQIVPSHGLPYQQSFSLRLKDSLWLIQAFLPLVKQSRNYRLSI